MVQAAVSYAVVDLGHGLHDGASRTEVEVADFGVAHESVGEADCASRSVEGGVGVIGPDAVHCRGSGKGHGVVVPTWV